MAEAAGFDVMAEDQLQDYDAHGEEGGPGLCFGNRWRAAQTVVGRWWVCDTGQEHLRDVWIVAIHILGIREEIKLVLGPFAGEPGRCVDLQKGGCDMEGHLKSTIPGNVDAGLIVRIEYLW